MSHLKGNHIRKFLSSKNKFIAFVVLLSFFVVQSLSLSPQGTYAYSTNMSASVVIGQPDFTSGSANQGGSISASGLEFPYAPLVIGSKLLVSDYSNSRVLIYNSIPTTNNPSADVVIGQTNLTSGSSNQGGSVAANTLGGPGPMTTDGTKLIVADYDNSRILIYNTVPTSNNAAADVVIGQPNMTTNSSGTTSQKMDFPFGVHYDTTTGKLFVSDNANSRVLIYNSLPTTNNAAADVVLGQADFTSGSANRGGSPAAGTLSFPYNPRVIEGKLFIADYSNSRVLVWNTIPTTNGAPADVVIGQQNFTSVSENQGGSVGANTLVAPTDIVYTAGELFIADNFNNRILIYDGIPTGNNASAYKVIGQPDLTSNSAGAVSAQTVSSDGFMHVSGDTLLFADTGNHRVLIYNDDTPPTPTPTPTSTSSSPATTTSSGSTSPARPPSCDDSAPGQVPDLFQVDATKDSATLYFVTAGNPASYHLVSYGYEEHAEQFGAQINLGSSRGVEKYTVNHLSPDTTYYFKIRGGNGCMPGGWSRIMKVRTDKENKQGGIIYYAYQTIIKRVQALVSY